MDVRRSDPAKILGDHEARILALERSPSGSRIYIDDRVITDPVEVVTFAVPSGLTILELAWEVTLDIDPSGLSMVFAGDYPTAENDYRWRLFGDVADDSDEPSTGNSSAALGGSALAGDGGFTFGPHWGRVRFPNYNKPDESPNLGIIWHGEAGMSDGGAPHAWLVSGCGDPLTPLTEINVFAYAPPLGNPPDGAHIVAPSRLTLTGF